MNILCISAQKPDSTGSGIYLAETARGFVAAGHRVAIIAGIDREDHPALPDGVQLLPVRYRTEKLPFPVAGMSDDMPYQATRYRDFTPEMLERLKIVFGGVIKQALRDFQPDLIVCHHLYLVTAEATRIVLRERRKGGKPCCIVAISHGTDLRQMAKHNLDNDFVRSQVQQLDCIFALHQAQRDEIAECYDVSVRKMVVLGTGYNASVFYDHSVREAKRTAVYAGKIWSKKGVPNLINALDGLPYRADQLQVLLAGGGNDQDEFDDIRKRAQESRYDVQLLGKLSQDQLALAYSRAQVFVLPSFFEGLPLVLIEALACGCVAVVTDLPGIRPWLQQRLPGAPVLYVAPPRMRNVDTPLANDLPAFEEHLATALQQAFELAAQRAAEGIACDTTALSWDKVAQRILDEGMDCD